MIWKIKKWGSSTYISLILEIRIIGKVVPVKLGFFCRNSNIFRKYMRDHILFYYFSYDHWSISGKVHIKWQMIPLYHCLLIDFKVLYQFQSASNLRGRAYCFVSNQRKMKMSFKTGNGSFFERMFFQTMPWNTSREKYKIKVESSLAT